MLLNCGVGEDFWESPGLQGNPTRHPKDQSWVFIGRTGVEAETPILWPPDGMGLTHLKSPWCWEGLRAGGKGDDRGWDSWLASPTRVWVNSRSCWWTGRPGMPQSMGLQRVRHDWTTELNCIMWDWVGAQALTLVLVTCLLKNRELHTDTENRLVFPKGEEGWGREGWWVQS